MKKIYKRQYIPIYTHIYAMHMHNWILFCTSGTNTILEINYISIIFLNHIQPFLKINSRHYVK